MADFSANEINEARRRVQEMRERAKGFVDEPQPEPVEIKEAPNPLTNGVGDMINGLFSSSDSSIILALVLILSHEKADNMLILALLYILL